MLNKIKTSIIVLLVILNLISVVSIYVLISFNSDELDYNYKTHGFDIHNDYVNNYNVSNLYHKNEGKQKYLKNIIFLDNSVYFGAILTINSLSLFLWFLLLGSFCVGESECDCNCGRCCCDGSCNCNNCNVNNNDAGKAALVCLVFICLILIIYYSLKCCGKHLSRHISIICYIFNNFCIFSLSLLMVRGTNNEIAQIMIISGISLIINLLALVLPNINFCKRLRFHSRVRSSEIINYNINQNQIQIPQINNNNVMINNNMNNFNDVPIQANYVVDPNMYKTNEAPVVNSENNSQNQIIERNVSINQNDSNNQLFEDNNKDLGGAPLPAYEMQVKK